MRHYTVYEKENDVIVATGTAEECALQLKRSLHSFYSMISRTRSGKNSKYIILIEEYDYLSERQMGVEIVGRD